MAAHIHVQLSVGEKCVSLAPQPIFVLYFLTKSSFWEIPTLCVQSQGLGRLGPVVSVESARFPGLLRASHGTT